MERKITVLLLAGLIGFFTMVSVFADSQVDVGLHIPYMIGIESDDEDFNEAIDYAFLVPDLKYNYFFLDDTLKVGVGARLFTVILESFVYPIVTVEAEVDKFVLSAHVGGFGFFFFGLYNDFATESIMLPEISAAYKFNEWFSLGTGVMFFFAPETADFDNFGYVGDVFARFTF
jgi:hypothetical protein